ncbi:MAG: hypothetical protein ACJ8HI_11900 [Massilia sp.]
MSDSGIPYGELGKENAASIAGLMLTTDAMVCELPEDKSAGGMPGGRVRR